jgi:hypothetical protein
MMRKIAAIAALLALALAVAHPGTAAQTATPVPTPSLTPAPAATRTPPLYFTGQLLDVRDGYVYFTTGDAFKMVEPVHVTDLDTGLPTTVEPRTLLYARATLDPKAGEVIELAITKHYLRNSSFEQVAQFISVRSTPVPAPELQGQERVTGRPVAITFFAEVPPTTSFSDNVYLSTDAGGWNAQQYKLDRIDATHFRLTLRLNSGTKLYYRYTRGTWNSVERGRDGLEPPPHYLFVHEVDAQRVTTQIFYWSDSNPSQPQVGPDSIPTPFNPNPFGALPGINPRTGKPQPGQTPPR